MASAKSANPEASSNVEFNPESQSFTDGWGVPRDNEGLSSMLEFDERVKGTGQAGNATLRRHALFNSLLQSVGNRSELMEFVHQQQSSASPRVGGALEKSFYSLSNQSSNGLAVGQVQSTVDATNSHWVVGTHQRYQVGAPVSGRTGEFWLTRI